MKNQSWKTPNIFLWYVRKTNNMKQHFCHDKKKTSLKLWFFLLQVKGTLSFTSHTRKWSINTVTDLLNQLGYKQKTRSYELCYFFLTFGSREDLKSCFSPVKSSRNPSFVRGGDILSYKLLGKVHRLKPGGVCATSRRASLQRRQRHLRNGLCFHEMNCWKLLIITIVIIISVWTYSVVPL